MNFASAQAEDKGLWLGSTRLELTGSPAQAVAARPQGSAVLIGFRPEDLALADGHGANFVRIPAKVDVVEYLGREELVHAQAENIEIVALLSSGRTLQPGEQVELAAPVEKLHLFDPETELRLTA
jgi:multiple sugar transport system ATP-binding protein